MFRSSTWLRDSVRKTYGAICLIDANNIIHRAYYTWKKDEQSKGVGIESHIAKVLNSQALKFYNAPYGRLDRQQRLDAPPSAQSSKGDQNSPLSAFLGGTDVLAEDPGQDLRPLEQELWQNDLVYCWDAGTSMRKVEYPDYKKNRRPKAPELLEALEVGREWVKVRANEIAEKRRKNNGANYIHGNPRGMWSLPSYLEMSGTADKRDNLAPTAADVDPNIINAEGDDIMFTFCRRLRDPLGDKSPEAMPVLNTEWKKDEATTIPSFYTPELQARPITVITSDYDLMACLQFENVLMHDTRRVQTLGPVDVMARYKVVPSQVPIVKCYSGDRTDSIPGLPGCGAGKCANLLEMYPQGLPQFLENNAQDWPKMRWTTTLKENPDHMKLQESLAYLRYSPGCVPAIDAVLEDIAKDKGTVTLMESSPAAAEAVEPVSEAKATPAAFAATFGELEEMDASAATVEENGKKDVELPASETSAVAGVSEEDVTGSGSAVDDATVEGVMADFASLDMSAEGEVSAAEGGEEDEDTQEVEPLVPVEPLVSEEDVGQQVVAAKNPKVKAVAKPVVQKGKKVVTKSKSKPAAAPPKKKVAAKPVKKLAPKKPAAKKVAAKPAAKKSQKVAKKKAPVAKGKAKKK